MKKGRRPSIAQGYQESSTIEGGEFQIIPRKVSIRKNNSGVFNNNWFQDVMSIVMCEKDNNNNINPKLIIIYKIAWEIKLMLIDY